MEIKEIIGQKFERTAVFERSSIDEKKRTVSLSFSSEEPYERYWGVEILDHGRDSVILDRLNSGAPLLVNHDTRDQVGVLEQAIIGADRRGRAVVRFGRSQRAEEIFQDVIDGIRSKVSVGYRIHKMVLEKEENGIEYYRVTSWEPFEVSLVAIPADNSVGVGRSEERNQNMGNETIVVEDEGKRPRSIRREEQNRSADVLALGKRFNQMDLAIKAVEDGTPVDVFKQMILSNLDGAQPIRVADPEAYDIGMSQSDLRRYSLVRVLRYLADRSDPRLRDAAGFELEISYAADRQRQQAGLPAGKGVLIPHDVLKVWNHGNRTLSAGGSTAGAELVATNLLAGSFIDVLRNASVVMSLGARPLAGLVGNVAIPRKTSGSTAGWITPEGADAGLSEPQFDQVMLSPKTLGAFAELTRNLLLQSSLDAEFLVRADLAAAVALAIDLASLYGPGTGGQPKGVRYQTGINMPTAFAAAVPTRAEIVAMESAVAVDNALFGNLGYIIEPTMRGALKTQTVDAGSGRFTMEKNDELNGYKAGVTSQVTAGDVFFGNWADLLIGFWGGLDIIIDPYTKALSGTLRVVVHQSCDVALRHGSSFAFNNDNA